MSDGPLTGYLFQCQETDLFAVTVDRSGNCLPPPLDNQRWILQEEFTLGLLYPVTIPVDTDQVIRGIKKYGYYIFDYRQGKARTPASGRHGRSNPTRE